MIWLSWLFRKKEPQPVEPINTVKQPRPIEVWKHPDKCDCCGVIGDGSFSECNIYPPDMTFVFCPECERDTRACNKVIAKATKGYHDYIRRLKNEDN